MPKPSSDAIEKKFNDDGIFFLEEKSVYDILKVGQKALAVNVEMRVPDGAELPVVDFSYSVVNRRGVAVLFTDFGVVERETKKHLQFKVSIRMADDAPYRVPCQLMVGMTFLDFCFYCGNEAIPESYGQDVFTIRDDSALKLDLGWYLPIRFVDPFIEALSKMNDSVFAGLLQESILYGPYLVEPQYNGNARA